MVNTLVDPEDIRNIARLKNLKMVGGRNRVASSFSPIQEDIMPDVSKTSQGVPYDNTPIPSEEGGLVPETYDVRANKVLATPQKQQSQESPNMDKGFWYNLGQSLANHTKNTTGMSGMPILNSKQAQENPVVPIPQDNMMEQREIPNQTEEESPGFLSSIGSSISDYFSPKKREEMTQSNEQLMENSALKAQGIVPEEQEKMQMQNDERFNSEIDDAMKDPYSNVVYGATDEFAKSPELKTQLETYTGMDWTPQVQETTKEYEKVLADIEGKLNGIDQSLTAHEASIKQRIDANQATDQDKYYIGLALLMPLIIGGFFGAGAGLGALSGGMKSFVDLSARRGENLREDEKSLLGLSKERGNLALKRGELALERASIPEKIRKSLPEDELKDIKGMQIEKWISPTTGEEVNGLQVLPGLVAELKYANTTEKRKELMPIARDINNERAALERANVATKNVIKAASQIKNPSWFGQAISLALSENQDSKLLKAYRARAPEIMVDGRKVNAAVYLDSQIEQIKDAYRRNEGMKAFTNTVASHIGSMVSNPLYSGLKGSDLQDQILSLRDRAQNFFVDRVKNAGFYTDPIVADFGKKNREIYGTLNKKAEDKDAKEILKTIRKSK